MTYEKFAKAVEEATNCDRKTIAKTSRRMIIILASLAVAVGMLIGTVFKLGGIFCSTVLFLILIFSFFSFVAEDETPSTFFACQKIGKFYPIAVLLMIVVLFAIKLLLS